ncbi:MAG: glycosyltransferase [Opitutus sp.]
MNNLAQLESVWRELRQRGLIDATPPQALAGGNQDRALNRKSIYRVRLSDGTVGKITIGADLTGLVRRANSWAAALPKLTPALHFEQRIGDWHVVGEKFIEGPSLRRATLERTLPRRHIHRAFFDLVGQLAATQTASNAVDRQLEWEALSTALTSLAVWHAPDRAFLQKLLARLKLLRLSGDAVTRWVHGDLTDENIFIESEHFPRLIDLEFAQRSHFFDVEAARFHALSDSALEQPGLFEALMPRPGDAAFLHCWLIQVEREAMLNTPEYVAQWLPHRLSTIRELSGRLFGSDLNCPWPATFASSPPQFETVQLFWSSPVEPGWSEKRSERLQYIVGRNQSVVFSARDRGVPWRIDPSSSRPSSLLHSLRLLDHEHVTSVSRTTQELDGGSVAPLGDSTCAFSPLGATVQSSSGDPQVLLRDLDLAVRNDEVHWLELELCTSALVQPSTGNAETCCVEEARWLDLEPACFRISGWYHEPADDPPQVIHAVVDGVRIASSSLSSRPDVAAHFSGSPAALNSGYQLDLPPHFGGRLVTLIARHPSGRESFFHALRVPRAPKRATLTENFATWASVHDPDPSAPAIKPKAVVKFSFLLPVFNTPPRFLEECLDSVQRQHYPHWELRIVDDASTENVDAVLSKSKFRDDSRIAVQRRATNGGIAHATNDALAAATGEYVVLIDHDDVVRPHALAEFAARLAESPHLDAIYSDEDKIDADGVRRVPLLKPDPSPLLLCGVMFVGHLLCIRTSIARSLGGFDSQSNGIQDYEFFLRLTERTAHIAHVRRILYHWRMSASSSALTGNVKGDMDALQLKAVCAHLERTGRLARAVAMGGHRVGLVPLAENASSDCTLIGTDQTVAESLGTRAVIVAPSNHPAGIVESVRRATTRWIAIVTCPLQPQKPDWLERLLMVAAQPGVGAVGPVLLDCDGYVSSAGTLLNADGTIVPLMRGFAGDGEGYNGSLVCTREVLAISPECIVVERETLLSVTSEFLPNTFFDWSIDLCLALHTSGRRNVICASARLQEQRSSAPTSIAPALYASAELQDKWRTLFDQDDPFYPALSNRRTGDYRLRTDVAPPAERSKSLHHYVDVPRDFTLPGGFLRMRGWCYSTALRLQQVRLVVPTATIFGRYGTHRPDVAAVFPAATSPAIGFEIWGVLPAGRYSAALEFQDDAGDWLSVATLPINVIPRIRPKWLPGGAANDLVHFQLGARPSHAPRDIQLERFPDSRIPLSRLPRLTIVTPSYNQAPYLRETLRSVFDQAGVDVSYSVQDGASTDGSVALLTEASSQLKSWESVRDHGQADAIARAFRRTTGEPTDIMAWINSDDVYLPGALKFVAEYFAQHPDVDAIYGHRILIDEQSREIGRWFLPPHNNEMLQLNDYVPQETLFWRRRIWDRVGGIDPSFHFAMDWDLLLRFVNAGANIVRVPYFLACFRIHPVQKTSAQIDSLGAKEIAALRAKTQGRLLSPAEVETDPRLLRYLRKSAWIEFLWRTFGIRHP